MSTEPAVKVRKKLIEVALPLEAINTASAREKSIRHGHPSTLHLWWARRPLAAARAVIFSQMVIDPSDLPEEFPTEEAQDAERHRLFRIIDDLVQWENTTNETVLKAARDEILASWRRICADNADHPRAAELFDLNHLPGFHDPFAGGGALPLEAQRLGLESHASDLNPVAVLINKAMIEIPPKFAGRAPVNPAARKAKALIARNWKGAQGLADDVRHYGQWMRDEAEKRIGALYPKVAVTAEMAKDRPDLKPYVGQQLTVIAWLWARTVKSPNPAYASVDVPLASTFMLSTKTGKEAYVEPVIEGGGYRFTVKMGKPKDAEQAKGGTKLSRGANFACLMSGAPMAGDYIKGEGKAGRMGARLMAIVAEGARGRVYLAPTLEHEAVARLAKPDWKPEVTISGSTQYLGVKPYGMDRFDQLFTDRQLVALATFSDLVGEAMRQACRDAFQSDLPEDPKPLCEGGIGAAAYAEAVGVYLGFLVNQVANHSSSVCGWNSANTQMRSVFARQAIPMVWDFAESNPLCESSGSFANLFERQVKGFIALGCAAGGVALQSDANQQVVSRDKLVSTDPPYYDNVPYADLSDFFYVWLRRSVRDIFPEIFATLAVPKSEELVAFAYRHEGGKSGAEAFFLEGMTQAMHRVGEQAHPAFPVTIYYAFKQAESDEGEAVASTGWETFIDSVIRAGFGVSGTWPIRTEKPGRVRENDANALASSIVLVCRKRDVRAPATTRQAFVRQLDQDLPNSLRALQLGGVAPVDMAQAAIGPGMALFTRYSKVLEADGTPMSVRSALVLINEALSRLGDPEATETDDDTRWAVSWFEQNGFGQGDFGQAQVLAGAKNVGINGLVDAGIVHSRAGKVRLLKREELHGGDPMSHDPLEDDNLSAWEALQHLVHRHSQGGTEAAGALLRALSGKEDQIKDLAYRLYGICERKKWAQEAMVYNALVADWSDIVSASQGGAREPAPVTESGLFGAAPGDDDA
jgi:putative DNA methylase